MQEVLAFVLHNYLSAMRVVYSVQLVMITWNVCTSAAAFGSVQNSLLVPFFYDCQRVMFEVKGCCAKSVCSTVAAGVL